MYLCTSLWNRKSIILPYSPTRGETGKKVGVLDVEIRSSGTVERILRLKYLLTLSLPFPLPGPDLISSTVSTPFLLSYGVPL